jgi:hypothetical protein
MSGFICPICGFDGLEYEPYVGRSGSTEICPCCGFHFGVTEWDEFEPITLAEWRAIWIKDGMPWRSLGNIHPPLNWDPVKQIRNLTDEL